MRKYGLHWFNLAGRYIRTMGSTIADSTVTTDKTNSGPINQMELPPKLNDIPKTNSIDNLEKNADSIECNGAVKDDITCCESVVTNDVEQISATNANETSVAAESGRTEDFSTFSNTYPILSNSSTTTDTTVNSGTIPTIEANKDNKANSIPSTPAIICIDVLQDRSISPIISQTLPNAMDWLPNHKVDTIYPTKPHEPTVDVQKPSTTQNVDSVKITKPIEQTLGAEDRLLSQKVNTIHDALGLNPIMPMNDELKSEEQTEIRCVESNAEKQDNIANDNSHPVLSPTSEYLPQTINLDSAQSTVTFAPSLIDNINTDEQTSINLYNDQTTVTFINSFRSSFPEIEDEDGENNEDRSSITAVAASSNASSSSSTTNPTDKDGSQTSIKHDASLVADLISSENMDDFFDEIYDLDYGGNRRYSNRFDASNFSVGLTNEPNATESMRYQSLIQFDKTMTNAGHSSVGSSFPKTVAAVKSSLKRKNDLENDDCRPVKKVKKGIKFDSVSVYYFPRTQGFTCIPSQGGSTLGMSWNHSHCRKFSLGEHAAEQRRIHRQFCNQQFSSNRNWNEMSNFSSDDSDSDEVVSDSEVDYENYNFLQPIPTRERRALLRASGIHKIDSGEKDECRSIRLSREFCGCTCQVHCDPEKCVCAQAGIKCQVDRMNFPCSCSREGCANGNGRVEFNPIRVRTHYIHTLMRLEMEKKKEEEEQRNHMILRNLENLAALAYPAASSSHAVAGSSPNFGYHGTLSCYYSQQSSTYDLDSTAAATSMVNAAKNARFKINNYPMPFEDPFLLSNTKSLEYQQSQIEDASLSLCSSFGQDVQRQSPIIQAFENPSTVNENEENQSFAVVDLQNVRLDKDDSNTQAMLNVEDSYADRVENFEVNVDKNVIETAIADTSAETSEEVEKEGSDSENFGDIIKKTMVESVSA